MARITTPLTDTQIKTAKPKYKEYSLSDGSGLYLLVKSNGSKIWRFNYYRPVTKKRALISFGSYPEISLQLARKQKDEARELIKQGIDPQEYKASETRREIDENNNTFKVVAEKWFNIEKSKDRTEETLTRIWTSLKNHIFPKIGNIPISKITPHLVINTLEPLKNAGKLSTVKRVCQRINNVMIYATNTGLLSINPLSNITTAFEVPLEKNRPTIKRGELPEFMQVLSVARIELQTRCLIEWQLLTLTRPSEAVGAKWEEIDFINKLWTIPATRMKMRREHIITLNNQALAILSIMKPISGHREYVFPSMKPPYSKSMNSSTANMAIKRMGYKDKLVAHGLRALASTILNEQGFDPNVIEASLAHIDTNSVRRAYNRATYLEQRRIMLDWWGQFVEDASNGSVSLSGNKVLKIVNN